MAELDHWHPVLLSSELGKKPSRVTLAGREIVVFRGDDGKIGALSDVCPHRGMRLSDGHVERGRIVCPYHAWAFSPCGEGVCPATPAARPRAESFDAVERLGAIWIKRAGAAAAFPAFDVSGYHLVGRSKKRAKAPLEVTLDNFIEVEHTPSVHVLLGYAPDRMAEVEHEASSTDTSVHVYNVGPQKRIPRPFYSLLQIEPGDLFVDEWTTYFSPVYTVYDQYWLDPKTRERRASVLRIAVFFVPVSSEETDVLAFMYTVSPPWERFGLNALWYRLTERYLHIEVARDVDLLGKLADKRVDLRGRQLGRFDKPLGLARKRITSIYRGEPAHRLEVVDRA